MSPKYPDIQSKTKDSRWYHTNFYYTGYYLKGPEVAIQLLKAFEVYLFFYIAVHRSQSSFRKSTRIVENCIVYIQATYKDGTVVKSDSITIPCRK